MDQSTRRLDQSESPAAPTSKANLPFAALLASFLGFDASPIGPVSGSVRPDGFPLGTPQRNPSSPFPDETGKRTLETGPCYER